MNRVDLKLDIEPKSNYEKARKLLIETYKAFQLLSLQERELLIKEIVQYQGIEYFVSVYNQHRWR